MATIYKRDQDSSRKRSCWYIGFTDERDKRRTRKGFTDKGKTEQLAAKLENEVMLRKRGLIDPDQERAVQQKKRPLSDHLADFEKSLTRSGQNTAKHVQLTMTRVKRIVEQGQIQVLSDLDEESVETAVAELQEKHEFGARTYNHYVQAIDSFANWLESTKRLPGNPIRGIKRVNAEVDVRHQRRALTDEEFAKLVASARASGISIQCYDGEQRARIYILSYMTGLRRKELATLTPESFDLDADQPILEVEAACSKHRRKDTLPLHPELTEMLREWVADLDDDEPLFPKLERRRTWLMVKKDLERIGIPYETKEGIADFHAAGRHTHITELLRKGASLPEARELARHSDIRMTMKYTHIGLDDQAKAVARLRWECSGSAPDVSSCQSASSGGTEGGTDNPAPNDASPVNDRACRQFSSPDNGCQNWRRRESNPRPVDS